MKTLSEFHYGFATLAQLSGWKENTIRQASVRDDIRMDDLASICVWLAENGRPRLRAAMAAHLIPVVLGTGRDTKDHDIENMSGSFELLTEIFERADKPRRARAKNISKGKAGVYHGPGSRKS